MILLLTLARFTALWMRLWSSTFFGEPVCRVTSVDSSKAIVYGPDITDVCYLHRGEFFKDRPMTATEIVKPTDTVSSVLFDLANAYGSINKQPLANMIANQHELRDMAPYLLKFELSNSAVIVSHPPVTANGTSPTTAKTEHSIILRTGGLRQGSTHSTMLFCFALKKATDKLLASRGIRPVVFADDISIPTANIFVRSIMGMLPEGVPKAERYVDPSWYETPHSSSLTNKPDQHRPTTIIHTRWYV
jgi:hypothetical protein